MELAATPVSRRRARGATLRFDGPALGAWTLGFAPVLYLALRGGGYDVVIRSQVGLAAWWLILLGVLAGAVAVADRRAWLGVARPPRRVRRLDADRRDGQDSAERTVDEVGRLSTYLAMFLLALLVVRRTTVR